MTDALCRASAEYDQLLAGAREAWRNSSYEERAELVGLCMTNQPLALTVIPPGLLLGLVQLAIVTLAIQEREPCE